MKIKFLGTGSAFALGKENFQSNVLISKEINVDESLPVFSGDALTKTSQVTKRLLYDAGTTLPDALDAYDLKPQDLDSVYISHLHADHAGGVEYLGFKTYFECFNFGKSGFGQMKPKLYGHQTILKEGWDHTWSGGLASIQGQTNTLETYFDTTYMDSNDSFDFYGTEIRPIQTVHVVDDRMINPSFGIMFKDNDINVFISGDSQFAPNQMLTYFGQADLIFHDCEFAEYPNSVHAQFHQLQTLPDNIKKKMWLYHYMLNGKTFEELNQEVIDAGFAGLVKKGQEFTV